MDVDIEQQRKLEKGEPVDDPLERDVRQEVALYTTFRRSCPSLLSLMGESD